MIIEDTIDFLRKTPPFQFLDDALLKSIAASLTLQFYPKDTVILRQRGLPSESVWIIKKGGVKVSMAMEDGGDVVVDYRGDGENFGFLSLIGDERQMITVTAVDDTICYLLSKDKMKELIEKSPAIAEYFMSYLSMYVKKTYREMQSKSLLYRGFDRLLFTTKVGDIARRPVTIDEDTPIRDAARKMAQEKVSSLIAIKGETGLPTGIITDKDLREKVVALGRDISEPVKNIMTISLIRADAEESCFDAIMKMIKYNIHHILVIKEGYLYGIMTNHDLMLLQGSSPLSLSHSIDNQQSIEGLVSISNRLNTLVGLLLKEGARSNSILAIVAEINDRLVRKVVELAEKRLGSPPVPYCWVVFGSEGRREQLFKTDQDNAIIYADPPSSEEGSVKKYFATLARIVHDSLIDLGYPECSSGFMAINPEWCQPLKVWKDYFRNWIERPKPAVVAQYITFFDMRPIYGKQALAEELRDSFRPFLKESGFLNTMAQVITRNKPPVGFLKSYVIERDGRRNDFLDLKQRGTIPLVDIIRFFSLEMGLSETSTIGRINLLRARHPLLREYADEIEHVYEFIMLLRIQHQYEQITSGVNPDNIIIPSRLTTLEKKTIREAFHLISKLQKIVGSVPQNCSMQVL